jgi:protein TonB
MTTHRSSILRLSALRSSALRPNASVTHYGAMELKAYMPTSTLRGFWGSMSVLVLLFLGYSVYALANRITVRSAPVVNSMKIMNLPPPPTASEAVVPPPAAPASLPTARAGTPVPVPDALVIPDVTTWVDAITRPSDGLDEGIPALPSDITVEVREEEPDVYEITPVEREPFLDIRELQKLVVYPEVAKRAGIEGRVFVRVLVGKNGVPKKHIIEGSDSDLLNAAAAKAVMSTVFTPAIQNNKPVECWVSIPIIFRLR